MNNKSFSRKTGQRTDPARAELIRSEVKDPRVGMVSITEVEVTPDYAHARFTSLAGDDRLPKWKQGLKKAAAFLRRELFRRIRIHTTPELHFIHDNSMERGADLSKLIDEAARLSDATPDE